MERHPIPLSHPQSVEPSGQPADLVEKFAVAQETIQISDCRKVRSAMGLPDDRRQDVGLHGCNHRIGAG